MFYSPFTRPQVPLEDLLQPAVPPDALDLMKGLLVFNPEKRLTAEQALQHPYVAKYEAKTFIFSLLIRSTITYFLKEENDNRHLFRFVIFPPLSDLNS